MENSLSEVLSEFARTMATDFPIQSIIDQLVDRIVKMLPIDGAGVTLISPDVSPHYLAASDDLARKYEQLQTELNEGPCRTAYQSGTPVSVPDLHVEARFPVFASRALAAGLVAVFTFPLGHQHQQLGAMDLYRTTAGPLGAEAMAAAQTLADVVTAYLINASNREELRLALTSLQQEALHDGLTGLPNRQLFMDRLDHALARSSRSGLASAVLFIDLDKLKTVNDRYGHAVGDELLVAVADRLLTLVRPGDTLARLSGDEFVLVCEDLANEAQAVAIGNRLVAALTKPYALTDVRVQVSASIGIACAGPRSSRASQVLHQADCAMYFAKRSGGGRLHLFDPAERQLARSGASLEGDLAAALLLGQLRNDYQPIFQTADNRIQGFEALLRWAHPDRGEISSAVIIPLAERSDLIGTIGGWTLSQALADRSRWRQHRDADDLAMWVNVSAQQVLSDTFLPQIKEVITLQAGSPELLTLEISQSVFLRDGERAVAALTALRNLGVRLALDDFGTGYSSMDFLKKFPIDVLKIDGSFISDLGVNDVSDTIMQAMVDLAHKLGMSVVAQGVETADHRAAVTALGCDLGQGLFYALPMPAAQADALVGHRTAVATATG